jgi:hypothetical protein
MIALDLTSVAACNINCPYVTTTDGAIPMRTAGPRMRIRKVSGAFT